MNNIKIGFSSSNSITSKIIRWFTKSKVSHCWFLFHDTELDKDVILQAALPGGYQMTAYDQFVKTNTVVMVISPQYSVDAGLQQSTEWLGESYDILGLIGNIPVLLGRWLKRKWHNPFHSSKTLFCSDVIVDVLQLSNYPGSNSLVPKDTNPEDLLEFLSK